MCVFLYNLTLFYSVSLIYFLGAATAFDIFGTDNAEELLTCGFQYPSLPISILHFVARIFGRQEKKVLVGKKSSSHLSGRCAIVFTTRKKKF